MTEELVFVCQRHCGPNVEARSGDLKCAKCGADVVVKKRIKDQWGHPKYVSVSYKAKPRRRKEGSGPPA